LPSGSVALQHLIGFAAPVGRHVVLVTGGLPVRISSLSPEK
jgi:hypothetical protein